MPSPIDNRESKIANHIPRGAREKYVAVFLEKSSVLSSTLFHHFSVRMARDCCQRHFARNFPVHATLESFSSRGKVRRSVVSIASKLHSSVCLSQPRWSGGSQAALVPVE